MFSVGAIVLLQLGVYGLAEPIRRSLRFEYTDPTILTAYTAHFVHFSLSHLLTNLAVFVLVSSMLYYFLQWIPDVWIFLGFLVAMLSALPIVLSFLNLAIPRNGVTYGFSGINMTLVGCLPVVIVWYLEVRLRRSLDTTILLTSFFVSIGYIVTLLPISSRYTTVIRVLSMLLSLLFATVFVRSHVHSHLHSHSGHSTATSLGQTIPPAVVGVCLWVALLSAGFQTPVVDRGSIVNVYIHFVGYALGFTTAYLTYEWQLLGNRPQKICSRSG